MEWIMLLLAGIFEVTWAVAMKYSEGFTKLVPSVITAHSSRTVRKNGYTWINVRTMGGVKGWVASAFVKENARADVATARNGLNVRSGRGTGYTIYYSIPHGATCVTVYKINGNWAYVSWNGRRKGWASRSYLRWSRW